MDSVAPWPIARALSREGIRTSAEPSAPVETIVRDLWPEPVGQALTVPLAAAASNGRPNGVIVVGLNPRVSLDRAYADFVEQAAREIATGLDRVRRLVQERQAALDAAHAERKLLEDVFDLSPAFLAVVRGPEHVFELANSAYYQLIGHRPAYGQKVIDALPEVAGQGFVELLDRVYPTGEPFVGNELPIQLQVVKGGALEERHVNFVYQPMRDADGMVTGVLVSGVDVTALVRHRPEAAPHRARAVTARDRDRGGALGPVPVP